MVLSRALTQCSINEPTRWRAIKRARDSPVQPNSRSVVASRHTPRINGSSSIFRDSNSPTCDVEHVPPKTTTTTTTTTTSDFTSRKVEYRTWLPVCTTVCIYHRLRPNASTDTGFVTTQRSITRE